MKTLPRSLTLSLVFVLVLIACTNNPTADTPATPDNTQTGQPADTTAKAFLPVADFIRGDISMTESYAAGVLLKRETGDKKDSAFISQAQFKQLAAEFLPPELDSASFHNLFTESLLANSEGDGMTFMYTTSEPRSSVRKVIVYTVAGDMASKVNRIYMEKEVARGDTGISQKLTWKMRQYLIIAENKQTSGGYNETVVRKAIWDPQRFGE